MTRPSQDQWVKIVIGAFLLGGTWVALTSAVSSKVDKADYVRDQTEIRQRLNATDSLRSDVRAIRCYLQPKTIGCPP